MENEDIVLIPHGRIPHWELQWNFSRSSGSGGQNVNKVNSQAELRWNIINSSCLAPEAKAILIEKLARLITNEGDILVRSQEARDQIRNRQICLEKLEQMLRQALHKPKKRKPTKPTKAAKKKRLETKKIHAQKKERRQKPVY